MRSSVTLSIGLVLLGLLLWFAWGQTADREAPDGLAPPTAAGEPIGDAPTRAELPPGRKVEAHPAAPPTPDAADLDVDRAPVAANGLELVVLDEYGATVPEARVLVATGADRHARSRFRDLDLVDELMEGYGHVRVTDPRGSLRLERPAGAPTLLVATKGRLWGTRLVERTDPDRVELALERDYPLQVELLESTGELLRGVTIQLLEHSPSPRVRRTARTDSVTALATFPHVQRTVRDGAAWSISVEALLEERLEVALDPAALPEEVVTIILPATGFVEVTVLSERGTPLEGEAEVELGVLPEGEPLRRSARYEALRPTVTHRTEHGRARFSLVETGTALEIAVRRENSRPVTRVYGPGPGGAGETVSFEVQLGSDHPVIAFRAVEAGGAPLALVELSGRLKLVASNLSQENKLLTTTDANGDALLDLDGGWTMGTKRTLRLTLGALGDPEVCAQVDLSYELQPGINELGAIVFRRELPVFAAGRVITTAGVPVPGARILLFSRSGAQDEWKRSLGSTPPTNADGCFEVSEAPPGEQFRIGAAHPGLDGAPLDFAPGARDLVIVLEEEGAIAGDVRCDPEIPKQEVWVRITDGPDDLDRVGRRNEQAIVNASGAFHLGPLSPGVYEVRVGTRHEGGEVLTVPDVLVHGGETTRDPRLAGVDLRGRFHVHHVRLRSPIATELPLHGGFRYRLAGSAEWSSAARFMNDELLLVTPHARIDLEVFAARHRSARLDDVAGELELALSAGIPVRLLLRGDAPIPEAPLFVTAQLVPRGTGDSGGDDWLSPPVFDERREIVVTAPGPGEMEVQWFVERRMENSAHSARGVAARPRYVEVLDVPGVQTFELVVSAGELEEILGAMR